MPKTQLSAMTFAKVYPLYVQKAQRKNRTKEEAKIRDAMTRLRTLHQQLNDGGPAAS